MMMKVFTINFSNIISFVFWLYFEIQYSTFIYFTRFDSLLLKLYIFYTYIADNTFSIAAACEDDSLGGVFTSCCRSVILMKQITCYSLGFRGKVKFLLTE